MKNNKEISISLPSLSDQRFSILQNATEKAIADLRRNLFAERFPRADGVNYSSIDERVFLTQEQGWVPPSPELINAWFEQVKELFDDYSSDAKLGTLLGLNGKHPDRRIRAYRKGDEEIPYGIWRNFLELTGRVVPDIRPVLGIFDIA